MLLLCCFAATSDGTVVAFLVGCRYGSGGFAITSLITAISGQFTSNSALSAATTFWEDHAIGGAQLEVERAEESVGARALWVQNQYTSTCQWLATQ